MYEHRREITVKVKMMSHEPITEDVVATTVLLMELTCNDTLRNIRFHLEVPSEGRIVQQN